MRAANSKDNKFWLYGRITFAAVQKFIVMKKSAENIKSFLRRGVEVKIHAEDFQFYELEEFARLARSNETKLTIFVGDNLNFAECGHLVDAAGDFIVFVFP